MHHKNTRQNKKLYRWYNMLELPDNHHRFEWNFRNFVIDPTFVEPSELWFGQLPIGSLGRMTRCSKEGSTRGIETAWCFGSKAAMRIAEGQTFDGSTRLARVRDGRRMSDRLGRLRGKGEAKEE